MPIYPGRREGTHRVVVWKDGKRYEEIIEGSLSDARDHEAKMRLDLRSSRSRIQRRTEPLFPVFCAEEYEPHARVHLGAKTWSVRASVLAVFAEYFARLRPSEITHAAISQYTTWRLQAAKASSVNHDLSVLSALLRFAREDCGYPVPMIRMRKLREDERRVHVWTAAQQATLLETCEADDPDLLSMIVFMLQTGVRKGEVIAAPWGWLQKRGGLPLLLIGPNDAWKPKSRRPREVPVTEELWSALERLPKRSTWMFPRLDGERFREFPAARFRLVVDRAKLRGSPHTCRHSFASAFLDEGGSLQDLAAILGHSLTRTTELYVHLLPSHLQRARAVMNSMGRAAAHARAAG